MRFSGETWQGFWDKSIPKFPEKKKEWEWFAWYPVRTWDTNEYIWWERVICIDYWDGSVPISAPTYHKFFVGDPFVVKAIDTEE